MRHLIPQFTMNQALAIFVVVSLGLIAFLVWLLMRLDQWEKKD